jgi:predicted  nucleic acid-binding Zn-ribbon protein|tara:strand:- start:478 stop:711 length:234 start_codon:yes stop_codon:yes gene_type:complete
MAKIKQEELEKVTSIKKELDALVSEIGVVETQKHALLHKVAEVNESLAKEKKVLEEAYGKISIDLETGEYTEITEEA